MATETMATETEDHSGSSDEYTYTHDGDYTTQDKSSNEYSTTAAMTTEHSHAYQVKHKSSYRYSKNSQKNLKHRLSKKDSRRGPKKLGSAPPGAESSKNKMMVNNNQPRGKSMDRHKNESDISGRHTSANSSYSNEETGDTRKNFHNSSNNVTKPDNQNVNTQNLKDNITKNSSSQLSASTAIDTHQKHKNQIIIKNNKHVGTKARIKDATSLASTSSLKGASLKTADRSDHNSEEDGEGNRTSEEQSLEADPETRNCSEDNNRDDSEVNDSETSEDSQNRTTSRTDNTRDRRTQREKDSSNSNQKTKSSKVHTSTGDIQTLQSNANALNQEEMEAKMRARREKRRAEKEAQAKEAAAKERKRRDRQRQQAEEHLRQSKLKNAQVEAGMNSGNPNDLKNMQHNNSLINKNTGIAAAIGAHNLKGSTTSINSTTATKNTTIIAQQFQMYTSSQMQIGKGNFGVLYLGKRIVNNELIAIKLESRHGRSHTSQLEHEWAHYTRMESTSNFSSKVEGLPVVYFHWFGAVFIKIN